MDFPITADAVTAFLQVVMIDLVLAGDNAVVVGLAAAGLSKAERNKAIMIGIVVATVLRIVFALMTSYLLTIIGLLLAGGILLLWVCWKMWRELRETAPVGAVQGAEGNVQTDVDKPRKSFGHAIRNIIIADVSMSLDNVLAVAGAAHDHPTILVLGLALSVVLMGLAASMIAGLLERYRWIAYIGLAVILFVAVEMIYRGVVDIGMAMS